MGFGRFESEKNRPLAVGDKVVLVKAAGKKGLPGDEAIIENIMPDLEMATVKLEKGGKGSRFGIRLEDIKRP